MKRAAPVKEEKKEKPRRKARHKLPKGAVAGKPFTEDVRVAIQSISIELIVVFCCLYLLPCARILSPYTVMDLFSRSDGCLFDSGCRTSRRWARRRERI